MTIEELIELENSPYFISRRNEAQLAEIRYKARTRGRIEGANLLADLLKKGNSPDIALKMIKEGAR